MALKNEHITKYHTTIEFKAKLTAMIILYFNKDFIIHENFHTINSDHLHSSPRTLSKSFPNSLSTKDYVFWLGNKELESA